MYVQCLTPFTLRTGIYMYMYIRVHMYRPVKRETVGIYIITYFYSGHRRSRPGPRHTGTRTGDPSSRTTAELVGSVLCYVRFNGCISLCIHWSSSQLSARAKSERDSDASFNEQTGVLFRIACRSRSYIRARRR